MGRFTQTVADKLQQNSIELRYGKLALRELALDTAHDVEVTKATASLAGAAIEIEVKLQPASTVISFPQGLNLSAGQKLEIKLI